MGEVLVEPVAVRSARRDDLDRLVSVSMACARVSRIWAGADWTPPTLVAERRLWWERLRDEDTWVAVADAGITTVGSVALWRARETEDSESRVAYLSGPYVDPDWWGEGVGQVLHAQAMDVARQMHSNRVELVVEAGNQRARKLLKESGWRALDSGPKRSPMSLVLYGQAFSA